MGLGGAIRRMRGNPPPIAKHEKPKKASVDLPDEPSGSPPAIDFAMIFESFEYMDENSVENKAKRRRGIFHPSSGLHENTGLCIRNLIFELVFAPLSPTSLPSSLIKVLHSGQDRHVGLQAKFHRLAKNGFMGIIHVEDEVHCQHPVLPLSGHMDLLAVTTQGFRYAIDFKTWSSNNCAKTFEPEWKHRVQVNTYMGMAGIRAGYVVYENKDNQRWLGPPSKFRINFSDALFQETEGFCISVLQLVQDEQLPEFDEAICKETLMWCPYKDVCEAERNGAVTWKDFDKRTPEQKRVQLKVLND